MSSGISSQYGFLYQRKIFILHSLENAGTKQLLTFEGKDDIDVGSDDKIYAINSGNTYVQVKSGHVNKECFSRIICNWLLLDDCKTANFELALENDLNFTFLSEEVANIIVEYVSSGKTKKRNSIANRTYEKYFNQRAIQAEAFASEIFSILSHVRIVVRSMDAVDNQLANIFCDTYCPDIIEYPMAKEKRAERFIQYINDEIDSALKEKKAYVLIYQDFMRLIVKVTEEISDNKYTIDTYAFKKRSAVEARELVDNRELREVKQLFLVDASDKFVIRGIVNKLLYKDFRNIYASQKTTEISNLEQNAKENFESALFSLNENDMTPKSLYTKTVEQQIENNLLPEGMMYRNGCYVYLTGASIDEDFQITWGEDYEHQ